MLKSNCSDLEIFKFQFYVNRDIFDLNPNNTVIAGSTTPINQTEHAQSVDADIHAPGAPP